MTAAFLSEEDTEETNFLIIQDAFCVLSSVFYIWTLVNIHTTMARNQIKPDNKVMGLFVVALLFYVAANILYSLKVKSASSFGA
jgi:hypothetical protein